MDSSPANPLRRIQTAEGVFLFLCAGIFGLHYLHLAADFPNHSPWMDWSKYTDEGWYGDAAIRQLQLGRWNLPGDFNPAAALPVWPLAEFLLFRFTGVSLIAARALTVTVFGLILVASFLLLRRTRPRASGPHRFAPAAAVLLLVASPFCYAFTRLAILEPLLILLTLLALLTASFAAPATSFAPPFLRGRSLRTLLPALGLGLLLPLMVLTKTTALFLLPAIAWMLWASVGHALRPFLRTAVPASALAVLLWGAYYALIVRPHFRADFHYLFSANAYTGISRENALSVLTDTFVDGAWMGLLFYPLSLAALAAVFLGFRRYRRDPLVPALILWAGGYLFFLAYHNNLQPRYYLVVAVPLTLLLPVVFEDLLIRRNASNPSPPALPLLPTLSFAAFWAVVMTVAALDLRQTVDYVRTPQYTFVRAAGQLRSIIAADRTHSPLVLSISGSDLSLITGLHSICDDFGTMELPDRIAAYHPGWYVTWNEVDDDKMDALARFYRLQRVAEFPAMDDPERNLLILYRLDPPTAAGPHLLRGRASIRPGVRPGQHPRPAQLQH